MLVLVDVVRTLLLLMLLRLRLLLGDGAAALAAWAMGGVVLLVVGTC